MDLLPIKNNQKLSKTFFSYQKNNTLHSPFGAAYRYVRTRKRLRVKHAEHFNDLKMLGYTVIPNYLGAQECKKSVDDIKKAFEQYPSYVHKSEDQRIFGIEQVLPVARKLAQEIDFLELGELVNREFTYCAFTLAGWLRAGCGGSSGNGWHRDAFFSQFKAMLYLTDVSKDNGPFEILPGSHKLSSVLSGISKARLGYMQNRLSDKEAGRLEKVLSVPRKTLVGDAGTLILFNSSAVHRGRPINNGERFALTNYYFPTSRDPREVLEQFSPVLTAADVY